MLHTREKALFSVIPSAARNLSSMWVNENTRKRDSPLRSKWQSLDFDPQPVQRILF
jgi:hypothetical protein